MRFASLLPNRRDGESQSQYAERWLRDITPIVTATSETENAISLRERNEKLSSYLPIFAILTACYQAEIAKATRDYIKENPRPGKGEVTQWRDALDLQLKELEATRELLESYSKAVSQRLSASQTNLRTLTEEAKHGV